MVTPSPGGWRCRVQLAALFVPPPAGTFFASLVDSAGDSWVTPDIQFADLPAPGQFAVYNLAALASATGLPANEIRITAANLSNPPGSFIACSFVEFFPA